MNEGGHVPMTEEQVFGNAVLTPNQLLSLRYHHKQGAQLNSLEVGKLIETADFALGELEHLLKQPVIAPREE